jgi:hypothetical protein
MTIPVATPREKFSANIFVQNLAASSNEVFGHECLASKYQQSTHANGERRTNSEHDREGKLVEALRRHRVGRCPR